MVDVYYYSLTGNVRRFLAKTAYKAKAITKGSPTGPFVIVTNTMGFGEVPEPVELFLREHGDKLVGVSASGNRNWGTNYGRSARLIQREYEVPIILIFEMSGTPADVLKFNEGMRLLEELHQT